LETRAGNHRSSVADVGTTASAEEIRGGGSRAKAGTQAGGHAEATKPPTYGPDSSIILRYSMTFSVGFDPNVIAAFKGPESFMNTPGKPTDPPVLQATV
jgi:hypothetical protein